MKKTIIAFVTAMALFFSCDKNENLPGTSNSSNADALLISEAMSYFSGQATVGSSTITTNAVATLESARKQSAKAPLWNKAYTVLCSTGKAVVVPLQYKEKIYIGPSFGGNKLYLIDNIAKLLIYKDVDQHFHEQVLTAFPDSNYSRSGAFSGIILVEGWSGNFVNEFKYVGGTIMKLETNPSPTERSGTSANSQSGGGTEPNLLAITVCYSLDEYNYSVDDPDGGEYSSENLGCSTTFIDGGGSPGPSGSDYSAAAGGGSGVSTGSSIVVDAGTNVIANIIDYNKCFNNVAGSSNTYTVTVCVDQPSPGSRTPWGFSGDGSSGTGNPIDVGHTFLVMTENSPQGTITRNVGLYPQGNVTPFSPESQGQLNNDANHSYDISLTITVTNSQFFNILNYVALGNNPGFEYNLNINNCTTFAINALYQGDINLPRTIGTWPDGSGYDPGDLGQDIRAMNLSSNMTRNTVFNDHPNVGSCPQ